MPKGLKANSSMITVSFGVTESAPNTFTQQQIDLQLNVLDREVFVVTAIDLDPLPPDADFGASTRVNSSLSSTSRTAVGTLSGTNVLAVKNLYIRSAAGGTAAGAVFQTGSMESPPTNMDYVGIIATNDFYVQVEGDGNGNAKSVSGKLYGYRAIADGDTFAALTQSELLSA